MKVDRLRATVVSGAAALLIAGASTGAVLAADPSPEIGAPAAIEATEAAEAAEAPEAAEVDVPGGHEDADGVDVNHEFEGEE